MRTFCVSCPKTLMARGIGHSVESSSGCLVQSGKEDSAVEEIGGKPHSWVSAAQEAVLAELQPVDSLVNRHHREPDLRSGVSKEKMYRSAS